MLLYGELVGVVCYKESLSLFDVEGRLHEPTFYGLSQQEDAIFRLSLNQALHCASIVAERCLLH